MSGSIQVRVLTLQQYLILQILQFVSSTGRCMQLPCY